MRPALAVAGKKDGLSVRTATPGGSTPAATDHTYVPVPPVAVKAVSSWPMLKVPKFDPVEITTGGSAAASWIGSVAVVVN
jgi:hypothetical protein